MKSWQDYGNHFIDNLLETRISLVEITLLAALVLMCLVSVVECSLGRNVGSHEELRTAKQQAQQDLMALHSAQ